MCWDFNFLKKICNKKKLFFFVSRDIPNAWEYGSFSTMQNEYCKILLPRFHLLNNKTILEILIFNVNSDCNLLMIACYIKSAKYLFFFDLKKLLNIISNYIHIYIIGHYNPSVRIIDLVPHATYVVCVNFIHKWRDLQFKVDSERQIWETFHGNFIYSQSFCQKSAERKSPKKYFS